MSSLFRLVRNAIGFSVAAALLSSFFPAVASAQSVRGNGVNVDINGSMFQQISVNAYIDANGIVQGHMTWEGDNGLPGGRNNPSNPYIMDVEELIVDGNTAYVLGVVIASPMGEVNGQYFFFSFTDNSGTGLPDEIDGIPIDAGNFTVID